MKSWLKLFRCFRTAPGSPSTRSSANSPGAWQRLPQLENLEERTLLSASLIRSNFNGTPIAAGTHIWFNSVLKASGLGGSPVTLRVENAAIDFTANGTNLHLSVPNTIITFSPTATAATTTFDTAQSSWLTTVPSSLGGNLFMAGLAFPVVSNLPGGINPVTWSGNFFTDTAGVKLSWKWAAAVYTSFSTDLNTLGVKPVDSNQLSQYRNSDHAGTPENFRSFVIGGARGGGGSNFTGSYSGTASLEPEVQQSFAGLAGSVYFDSNDNGVKDPGEIGIAGTTVTLTGVNDLGQAITLIVTTASDGSYRFAGLRPGTYTIRETQPEGYQDGFDTPGNLGGEVGDDQFLGIRLNWGDNGFGYDFGEVRIES